MKKDTTSWLQNPTASARTTILTALAWVGLMLLVHAFLPTRSIDNRITSPFLFQAREQLGRSPQLHPSIRIFAIDDAAASQLGRSEMQLTEWVSVIEALDARKPKAIIIDALFSFSNVGDSEQTRVLLDRLAKIQTPIYTGAFASPSQIDGRQPLDLNGEEFQLDHYLDPSSPLPGNRKEQLERLSIADFRNYHVYGPHNSLRSVFPRTGHILYGDDEGNFYPFLRLPDGHTLPYIMMLPFDDVRFVEDKVLVNGAEFALNQDGSVPINFSTVPRMGSKIYSMGHFLNPKYRRSASALVQPDDYVYLVPLYFTGNTDFKPSPVGLIPGAYSHLMVLNSILQKQTLRFLEVEPLLIVGFAAAVAYFGWWMSPATLVITLLGAGLGWTLTCIFAFSYQNTMLPYLMPQASLFGVGVSLLLQRIYVSERKARMIRHALEGIVRPEALKALQRNPEKLSLDARERVITVVFIDIVGFSMMVENQLPRVAFEGLQQLIESMSQCIHKHGGIVNKTLGDGLLCFFGYSIEENREVSNHAEEALAAAIEIQQSNLPRILAAAGKREPVFPLRIGINTAAVFMGNLGAGERLDITVIGNGVNFAKRLESACLPHSVLVGPTTQELIRNRSAFGAPTRRQISIKHREDMVEAFEYDPLASQAEDRRKAEAIFEASMQIHRLERKWAMVGEEKVAVLTPSGVGQLQGFSASGLQFFLTQMVARGSLIEIQLDSVDGTLNRQLAKQGLQKIRVEVRSVQADGDGYRHGVRFLDLDKNKSDLLTDLLCQFGPMNGDESQDGSHAVS